MEHFFLAFGSLHWVPDNDVLKHCLYQTILTPASSANPPYAFRYWQQSDLIQLLGWNAPPNYWELVHLTGFAVMSSDKERRYLLLNCRLNNGVVQAAAGKGFMNSERGHILLKRVPGIPWTSSWHMLLRLLK